MIGFCQNQLTGRTHRLAQREGSSISFTGHILLVLLLIHVLGPLAARSEEVEVTTDSTQLRIGEKVIATLQQGERLTVVRRQAPWVYVKGTNADHEVRGWLLSTDIKVLVPSGINDDSPAPAPFGRVRVSVNGTSNRIGSPYSQLFMELTLRNEGVQPVNYDGDWVRLLVGDLQLKPIPASSPLEFRGASLIHMLDENGAVCSQSLKDVKRLGKGSLPAGESVAGWLCFPLIDRTRFGRPDGPELPWLLVVPLGEHQVTLDLLESEVKAVGLRIRPSSHSENVRVLEIGSRINMINFPRTAEAIRGLLAKEDGFLLTCTSSLCTNDTHVHYHFQSIRAQIATSKGRVVLVTTGDRYQNDLRALLGDTVDVAYSEEAGTAMVLSSRGEGDDILIQQMTSSSASLRAAAAISLCEHLNQQSAVKALINGVGDEIAAVQLASLRSLGAGLGGLPADWPAPLGRRLTRAPVNELLKLDGEMLEVVLKATEHADANVRAAAVGLLFHARDPRATQAVLKALGDSDTDVAANAIWASAQHPDDAIVEALLAHLTRMRDRYEDYPLTRALCRSLGQTKSLAAKERLMQLTGHRDEYTAAVAIEALEEMDAFSSLQAAMARLRIGRLRHADVELLVRTDDADVIAQLRKAMEGPDVRQATGAACVLAQRGEQEALDSLLRLLSGNGRTNSRVIVGVDPRVPFALGNAGDTRAIAPLQEALEHRRSAMVPDVVTTRLQIVTALWMLDATNARQLFEEDIKSNAGSIGLRNYLATLGTNAGEKATLLAEPLLDSNVDVDLVTKKLWEIATPAALEPLKQRLCNMDYTYSGNIIAALMTDLSEPPTYDAIEQYEKELMSVLHLVTELKASFSPSVSRQVDANLEAIKEAIGEGRFEELRSVVASKGSN